MSVVQPSGLVLLTHANHVQANDAGSISRQEAVSMVPPLFLDVHPHHTVLDMCAAPGSKTQQLLEALHSGGCDSMPSGFVVANDADFKRCNLLTHQTKRVCSPCLMVTNHSGEQFPEVRRTNAGGKVRSVVMEYAFDPSARCPDADKAKYCLWMSRIV